MRLQYIFFLLAVIFSHSSLSQVLDIDFNPEIQEASIVYSLGLTNTNELYVGGDFTSAQNNSSFQKLAKFDENGLLDKNFTPTLSDISGGRLIITILEPLADGKLYCGGFYTSIDSAFFVRLNTDGSIDNSFDADLKNNFVSIKSMLVQGDGKILVAGQALQSQAAKWTDQIQRLNTDGTNDSSFEVNSINLSSSSSFGTPTGLALFSDGNILFSGQFTEVNGLATDKLIKLNNDGTVNPNFELHEYDGSVTGIGINALNQIIVAGSFMTVDGGDYPNLIRLNEDGAIDNTYVPDYTGLEVRLFKAVDNGFLIKDFNRFYLLNDDGSQNIVYQTTVRDVEDIVLESDQDIVAAGSFRFSEKGGVIKFSEIELDENYNLDLNKSGDVASVEFDGADLLIYGNFIEVEEETSLGISKVTLTGTKSNDFSIDGGPTEGSIKSVCFSQSGQIYVTGNFSEFDSHISRGLVRLASNGTVDTGLQISLIGNTTASEILSCYEQPDGKIIIGGEFDQVNGEVISNLARLSSDGILDVSFNAENSSELPISNIEYLTDTSFLVVGLTSPFTIPPAAQIYTIDFTGNKINDFQASDIDGFLDVEIFENNILILTNRELISVNKAGTGSKLIYEGNLTAMEKISTDSLILSTASSLVKMDIDGNIDPTFDILYEGRVSSILFVENSLIIGGGIRTIDGNEINSLAKISKDGVKPELPTDLSAILVEGEIQLSWIDNSTIEDGFEIFRSVNDSDFLTLASVASNVTSFIDGDIVEGSKYAYKIRSTNLKNSDFSNVATLEVPVIIGLSDIKKDVVIYPNPSQGIFTLNGIFDAKQVKVYDLFGRRIRLSSNLLNDKLVVNLSGEPDGIYIFKLVNTDLKSFKIHKISH